MSTGTVELFKQEFESDPITARNMASVLGGGMTAHDFREDVVKQYLARKKKADLDGDLNKGTRPWQIINLTAKLDKNQPWIGIEYETGYQTKAAYQKVINFVWKNIPFTAIDREGCGNYPVEITFSPKNINEFMSDEYCMDQLIMFQNANDAAKVPHPSHHMVGTHINFSTPAYRALPTTNAQNLCHWMNRQITGMSNENKIKAFGRLPYGGLYFHNEFGSQWIEGKLFDSPETIEQWKSYKKVMARMADIMEFFSLNMGLINSQLKVSYYDVKTKKPVTVGSEEWYYPRNGVAQQQTDFASLLFSEGDISADNISFTEIIVRPSAPRY